MYQQDYILRQIEMMGVLLRRILSSIREGRTDEPLELIEEVLAEMGAGPDLVDTLPVEGLLAMLSAGGELDTGRAALLGVALMTRATVLEASGSAEEAGRNRVKAEALIAAAGPLDPAVAEALERLQAEEQGVLTRTRDEING